MIGDTRVLRRKGDQSLARELAVERFKFGRSIPGCSQAGRRKSWLGEFSAGSATAPTVLDRFEAEAPVTAFELIRWIVRAARPARPFLDVPRSCGGARHGDRAKK
jgi:hypothetical protein